MSFCFFSVGLQVCAMCPAALILKNFHCLEKKNQHCNELKINTTLLSCSSRPSSRQPRNYPPVPAQAPSSSSACGPSQTHSQAILHQIIHNLVALPQITYNVPFPLIVSCIQTPFLPQIKHTNYFKNEACLIL